MAVRGGLLASHPANKGVGTKEVPNAAKGREESVIHGGGLGAIKLREAIEDVDGEISVGGVTVSFDYGCKGGGKEREGKGAHVLGELPHLRPVAVTGKREDEGVELGAGWAVGGGAASPGEKSEGREGRGVGSFFEDAEDEVGCGRGKAHASEGTLEVEIAADDASDVADGSEVGILRRRMEGRRWRGECVEAATAEEEQAGGGAEHRRPREGTRPDPKEQTMEESTSAS